MITDHLGSVHAVVDEAGNVVESYRYDAWGRVSAYNEAGSPIAESAIGNRYLWQGREYSWKTGLYYFRARWYDPVVGRWLSKDPIGISGGLNQYVFCGGNPVNFVDPLGLALSMRLSYGVGVTAGLPLFIRQIRGGSFIEPSSSFVRTEVNGGIEVTLSMKDWLSAKGFGNLETGFLEGYGAALVAGDQVALGWSFLDPIQQGFSVSEVLHGEAGVAWGKGYGAAVDYESPCGASMTEERGALSAVGGRRGAGWAFYGAYGKLTTLTWGSNSFSLKDTLRRLIQRR